MPTRRSVERSHESSDADSGGTGRLAKPVRNWPGPLRRIGGGVGGLLLVGLAIHLAGAARPDVPQRRATFGDGSAVINAALDQHEGQRSNRWREGSQLTDQLGTFQPTGDRITFYPQNHEQTFCVLENLTLERIARVLGEARGRVWEVSGVVTEYRGANYVLIRRAVLKSDAAEPPERG